jgi:RimJ/RimL family protein N-acetyltransferase
MSIKLRKVKSSDWKLFLKWWKDKELISLTSGIVEDSDEVLRKYFDQMMQSKKDQHFIILLGRKPIGHISLMRKSKTMAEINIVIGEKQYWGKGIGTKAIKKATGLAFSKLKYKSICLEVRPDNQRAISTYENCGFIKKKIKRYPKTNQPVTLEMCLDKKL